jgi:phenylalanyl-tRNA synthetase alpha subunit
MTNSNAISGQITPLEVKDPSSKAADNALKAFQAAQDKALDNSLNSLNDGQDKVINASLKSMSDGQDSVIDASMKSMTDAVKNGPAKDIIEQFEKVSQDFDKKIKEQEQEIQKGIESVQASIDLAKPYFDKQSQVSSVIIQDMVDMMEESTLDLPTPKRK